MRALQTAFENHLIYLVAWPYAAPVEAACVLSASVRARSGSVPAATSAPALAGADRVISRYVLDLSRFDLEEIATALADQTDYEHRWLVDPKTGETVFWTVDTGIDGENRVDLDDLDLIAVDPLPSSIWYADMADFAELITDQRAGHRLSRAIRGIGAFRRFRDELHEEYPELLPAWYSFRDARARRRAVKWLADNELISHDEADRYLSEHPDQDLP